MLTDSPKLVQRMAGKCDNTLRYGLPAPQPRISRLALCSLVPLVVGFVGGAMVSMQAPRFFHISAMQSDFLGFLICACGASLAFIAAVVARWRIASRSDLSGKWIATGAIAINGTACVWTVLVYFANPSLH